MTTIGLSVEEIAAAIAARKVSAAEATAEHLAGLGRIAAPLNAVARLEPEAAAAAASAADSIAPKGPLHGVPLAHKDIYGRAGWLHEAGSSILKGHIATVTADSIAALDDAGAIDTGRLNTVEFALGPAGLNEHTGPVRNPWDTSRITGGSSSGSGAAVAARALPAALGSDTGGSIRIPAAACGVVGLKPTAGRIGRSGVFPLSGTLDTVGPLSATVRDAAILLDAMNRRDPADPQSVTVPPADALSGIEDGLGGLRLGVARDYFFDTVTAGVGAAMEEVVTLAGAEGAAVRDVTFPGIGVSNRLTQTIIAAEAASQHRAWLATRATDYGPQTLDRLTAGLFVPATAYIAALSERQPMLAAALAGPFAEADVVLTPALTFEAPQIEGDGPSIDDIGYCTRPFNFLGLPAIVIPACLDTHGVPIGVQLVARPFAEATLLRAARALERAIGFREAHKPPITA